MRIINPEKETDGGTAQALDALVLACTGPFELLGVAGPIQQGAAAQEPGLPTRVRVNDAGLAEAARKIFEPLHVPVEYAAELPAFDAVFQSMSDFVGAGEESDEAFEWDVDVELADRLVKAAAGFRKRAPWNYMPDHPPLAIQLGELGPEPGVETVYASILGLAGMVEGMACYYSIEDFRGAMQQGADVPGDTAEIDAMIETLRRAGAPVDSIPAEMVREVVGGLIAQAEQGSDEASMVKQNSLALLFSSAREADPTYLEWLDQRGIKHPKQAGIPQFVRTTAEGEVRWPNSREARALALALKAATQFFGGVGRMMRGPFLPLLPLVEQARVSDGDREVAVTVTFPPEGHDWSQDIADLLKNEYEEEVVPASPEAAHTLYRFQVKLAWQKTVWRRIEMRGDQTLHDLHEAIQSAFGWDDDHLYSFFLSGKAWDEDSEYTHPMAEGRSAERYPLERLPLTPKQQFLYIFDFGDELRHLIKVEAIIPDGVQQGAKYPRVTEQHGEAPPQYPYAEEIEVYLDDGADIEPEAGADGSKSDEE
jgi:hypothetical protein